MNTETTEAKITAWLATQEGAMLAALEERARSLPRIVLDARDDRTLGHAVAEQPDRIAGRGRLLHACFHRFAPGALAMPPCPPGSSRYPCLPGGPPASASLPATIQGPGRAFLPTTPASWL